MNTSPGLELNREAFISLAHLADLPLDLASLAEMERRELMRAAGSGAGWCSLHLFVLRRYLDAVSVLAHPWGSAPARPGAPELDEVRQLGTWLPEAARSLTRGERLDGPARAGVAELALALERYLQANNPFGPLVDFIDLVRPDVLAQLRGAGRLYVELHRCLGALAEALDRAEQPALGDDPSTREVLAEDESAPELVASPVHDLRRTAELHAEESERADDFDMADMPTQIIRVSSGGLISSEPLEAASSESSLAEIVPVEIDEVLEPVDIEPSEVEPLDLQPLAPEPLASEPIDIEPSEVEPMPLEDAIEAPEEIPVMARPPAVAIADDEARLPPIIAPTERTVEVELPEADTARTVMIDLNDVEIEPSEATDDTTASPRMSVEPRPALRRPQLTPSRPLAPPPTGAAPPPSAGPPRHKPGAAPPPGAGAPPRARRHSGPAPTLKPPPGARPAPEARPPQPDPEPSEPVAESSEQPPREPPPRDPRQLAERIAALNELRQRHLQDKNWQALVDLYEDGIELFEGADRQQVHVTVARLHETKLERFDAAFAHYQAAYELGDGPQQSKAFSGMRRLASRHDDQARAYQRWLEQALPKTDDAAERVQLQRELALILGALGEAQRAFYTYVTLLTEHTAQIARQETIEEFALLADHVDSDEAHEVIEALMEKPLAPEHLWLIASSAHALATRQGDEARQRLYAMHAARGRQDDAALDRFEASLRVATPEARLEAYEDLMRFELPAEEPVRARYITHLQEWLGALSSGADTIARQLADHPDDERALGRLASVHELERRWAEAYGLLRRHEASLSDDAARARALDRMAAIAATHLDVPDEAVLHYAKAAELGAPSRRRYEAMTLLYVDLGSWRRALDALDALMEGFGDQLGDEERVGVWSTIAQAAEHLGLQERRLDAMRHILAIHPDHEQAKQALEQASS